MKKIFSFILACVLCVAMIPASAFAETVPADDLFGVIVDADGNVVEYLQMPRGDVYINKVFVIPQGGYLRTLQYSTTQNFLFGYTVRDVDRKTIITEPYSKLKIAIELSNTIGGGSRFTYCEQSDTYGDTVYSYLGRSILYESDATNYDYCNGYLVNLSSNAELTVRIIIIRNSEVDYNEWVDLV